MGKIHQIIAVEKEIRSNAAKQIDIVKDLFVRKLHLFNTHSKLYEALDEADTERPEEEKPQPIKRIHNILNDLDSSVSEVFDCILQKENANTSAREDIIIELDDDSESIVLARNVPVAALVQIENILDTVKTKVYDTIPVLDETKKWNCGDSVNNEGLYFTDETKKQRTKKIPKGLVLHNGTDKHPPQVVTINEDKAVGTWATTFYSGLISQKQKKRLLLNVDLLQKAVKKARARANDVEVENLRIGKKLFNFISSVETIE